ncbi:MAG: hypothetical protein ABI540_03120 [Spartobacteria bacterium]
MREAGPNQLGYAFALPRLAARLAGWKVHRAELSRWEAYGLGFLVFGISCVAAARVLLPLVRPVAAQALLLCLLPFAIWVAFLLLYYVNALILRALRRLGLYTAVTNNPFQHFVIMTLTTALALGLMRNDAAWLRLLGIFWVLLLGLNLFSLLLLKVLHEA